MKKLLLLSGVAGAGKNFVASALQQVAGNVKIVAKYTTRPPRTVDGKQETKTDLIFDESGESLKLCDYQYHSEQYWYGFRKTEILDSLGKNDLTIILPRSVEVVREILDDFPFARSAYIYPSDLSLQDGLEDKSLVGRSLGREERAAVFEREFAGFLAAYDYFDRVIVNTFSPEPFIRQIQCFISDKRDEALLGRLKSRIPVRSIFIGHGRSREWSKLYDYVQKFHGVNVEAFESKSRSSEFIGDVLDGLLERNQAALLVLTGDDIVGEDSSRARQNVVHEAGLFQGRLGFGRTALLVESGVEIFSNMDGFQQIRFEKSKIEGCFSEVTEFINKVMRI